MWDFTGHELAETFWYICPKIRILIHSWEFGAFIFTVHAQTQISETNRNMLEVGGWSILWRIWYEAKIAKNQSLNSKQISIRF